MAKIGWALSLVWVIASAAQAEVLTRKIDTVGQVVTSKGDEQINPVEIPGWRRLDVQQLLVEGDQLRTGAYGGLGILFRDETQIRIHPNTHLQIKNIGRRAQGETRLSLDRGGVWMRAKTVPSGLSIDTPSATVSVRGTDWSLSSDEQGAATLVVLSGQVKFFNAFGEVLVERGETAFAEKGKPPLKRFIVQLKDQAQWHLSTGWLDLISLTGDPGILLREKRRSSSGTGSYLLQAQQAFDLADYEETQALLLRARAAGEPEARIALVDALVALQQERIADAEASLSKAAPSERREQLALRVAHYGLLIRQRDFVAATRALAELEREFGDFAEVPLAQAWRLSFQGALEPSLPVAVEGMKRFVRDVRFPIVIAHVQMLLGDPVEMRKALDAGLALDPENGFLLHLEALYRLRMRPDLEAARAHCLRALESAPNNAALWNDLALAYQGLGDIRKAEHAYRRAMALLPGAAEFPANLAILLITQDRLDEADQLLRQVVRTHPELATGPEGLGLIALAQGKNEEAVDWLLKAVLVNPGLSEAQTLLSIAYHRDERFQAADATLDSAIRYDANDPLPYLLKSMIAQEQAQAGKAIRYARTAVDAYLRHGEAAINGVQSSPDGNSGLASAYGDLGLANWGDYLSQRADNPYWANSYFSIQGQYASDNARLGALLQGLLLDPTAVSFTPRYADVGPRRTRHDLIAGASFTHDGNGMANSQSVTATGFVRDAFPMSYYVSAARSQHSASGANNDASSEHVSAALGANLDPDTGLLLRVNLGRSKAGLPGSNTSPDPDDRSDATGANAHLGLHRRLGFHDELLLAAYAARDQNVFRNADPFGSNLSPLDLSLVTEFGLDQTRAFYLQGMVDATTDPSFPMYLLGATLPGVPQVASTLPANLDLNTVQRRTSLTQIKQVQAKRLLDVGPLQVAYGAEWAWSKRKTSTTRTAAQTQANGILVFPDVASVPVTHVNALIAPDLPAIFFPYASTALATATDSVTSGAGQAYASARWPLSNRLLLDAGLKLQHSDNGVSGITHLNPHYGVAWAVADRHWLRSAYQRQSRSAVVGTMAPMASVGLSVPDFYLASGGTSAALQLQWDSEWNERLFSYARVEKQEVDGFSMPSADPLDNLVAGSATIKRAVAGVNLWLGEQWGMVAAYRHTRSTNLDGANAGKSLPLLPEHMFSVGATWVHPMQVRFNLSQVYTGAAQADLGNTVRLPGYWMSNASLNWQPPPKHWSLTLSAMNLFDRRYQAARNYSGNRRTLLLGVEYRN